MISEIGLLLFFTNENLTKKQKPFHTDRVGVIVGYWCTENNYEKAH